MMLVHLTKLSTRLPGQGFARAGSSCSYVMASDKVPFFVPGGDLVAPTPPWTPHSHHHHHPAFLPVPSKPSSSSVSSSISSSATAPGFGSKSRAVISGSRVPSGMVTLKAGLKSDLYGDELGALLGSGGSVKASISASLPDPDPLAFSFKWTKAATKASAEVSDALDRRSNFGRSLGLSSKASPSLQLQCAGLVVEPYRAKDPYSLASLMECVTLDIGTTLKLGPTRKPRREKGYDTAAATSRRAMEEARAAAARSPLQKWIHAAAHWLQLDVDGPLYHYPVLLSSDVDVTLRKAQVSSTLRGQLFGLHWGLTGAAASSIQGPKRKRSGSTASGTGADANDDDGSADDGNNNNNNGNSGDDDDDDKDGGRTLSFKALGKAKSWSVALSTMWLSGPHEATAVTTINPVSTKVNLNLYTRLFNPLALSTAVSIPVLPKRPTSLPTPTLAAQYTINPASKLHMAYNLKRRSASFVYHWSGTVLGVRVPVPAPASSSLSAVIAGDPAKWSSDTFTPESTVADVMQENVAMREARRSNNAVVAHLKDNPLVRATYNVPSSSSSASSSKQTGSRGTPDSRSQKKKMSGKQRYKVVGGIKTSLKLGVDSKLTLYQPVSRTGFWASIKL